MTQFKTAKINFINSGPVDIIRTVYYIHRPELIFLSQEKAAIDITPRLH